MTFIIFLFFIINRRHNLSTVRFNICVNIINIRINLANILIFLTFIINIQIGFARTRNICPKSNLATFKPASYLHKSARYYCPGILNYYFRIPLFLFQKMPDIETNGLIRKILLVGHQSVHIVHSLHTHKELFLHGLLHLSNVLRAIWKSVTSYHKSNLGVYFLFHKYKAATLGHCKKLTIIEVIRLNYVN